MSSPVAPNDDLAQLARLLGIQNVRLLLQTFLREYPGQIELLATADRKTRHRIAHSLKSSTRVVGAHDVSAYMAEMERRLGEPDEPDLAAADVAEARSRVEALAVKLRAFAESK